MIQKLAIGSANFGLKYGINNKKGELSTLELKKILNEAYDRGVNFIDTAQAYGSAEKKLGEVLGLNDKFNLITKLAPNFYQTESLTSVLQNSLNSLNIKQFYGVLYHDFNDFLNALSTFDELKNLKNKGEIKKIGFSLYFTKELDYLLNNNIQFDLIQIPYNIFDRRFEKYFDELKLRNIEIHVRSVFLQGLFFKKPEELSNYFASVKSKIDKIHKKSIEKGISIAEFCLKFAVYNPNIDKVVIGIDSKKQLMENILILSNQKIVLDSDFIHLEEENEKIILPIYWNNGK